MKIIFITSTLTSGGSERVMSLLANELGKRGHDVSIICLNKHIVFYPIDKQIKIIFAEEKIDNGNTIKKCLWLRGYVRKEKPDVVIPFMEAVYCLTLLSLIGSGIPIVSSERIDPRRSPFVRNILRRIFLPLTTHLVVQTREIKQFYPAFIRKKTSVIYNPVTDKIFDLSIEKKERRIISVGRLYPQKNHKMLIEAFGKIAQEYSDYSLTIFGEGPLRKELEDLVVRLKLTDRVFLPGRTENILTELNRSMLFCLSSDYEGMSNALIEAICLGLPIVTTKVSGVEELIQDGENGRVTNIKDVDAFSNAIKEVLSDIKLRSSFSKKNKEKAGCFKIETIANQWENLMLNIVHKVTE